MKFLHFCKHISAKWEGIVYQKQGTVYVTNGIMQWKCTPSRKEKLIAVEKINGAAFLHCLEFGDHCLAEKQELMQMLLHHSLNSLYAALQK